MAEPEYIVQFERQRAFLLNLSYRLLGSLADAEDAVQDTFVAWADADRSALDNPAAWLTTVCTRRCLDILRSAYRSRVDYVGTWLPEPYHMADEDTPESVLSLSSSLSMAFLLLLERLAPKERAAYLLHEIFDQSYPDVSAVLDIPEATCRKLVSRARAHVGSGRLRQSASPERQASLLSAFRQAIATGQTGELADLLSDEITLIADGGGKVAALLEPVAGKAAVLTVIGQSLSRWWRTYEWRAASINGACGALLTDKGKVVAALSFAYDDLGHIADVYVIRNPDKLKRLVESRESLR